MSCTLKVIRNISLSFQLKQQKVKHAKFLGVMTTANLMSNKWHLSFLEYNRKLALRVVISCNLYI